MSCANSEDCLADCLAVLCLSLDYPRFVGRHRLGKQQFTKPKLAAQSSSSERVQGVEMAVISDQLADMIACFLPVCSCAVADCYGLPLRFTRHLNPILTISTLNLALNPNSPLISVLSRSVSSMSASASCRRLSSRSR